MCNATVLIPTSISSVEEPPAAQIYPDDLCRAILRGVVQQKAVDRRSDKIVVPPMSSTQIGSFIESLSGVEIGNAREFARKTTPIGKWPANWEDTMHEPDGGMDIVEERPQFGIDILQRELDALTMRNGITVARDDVSGAELVPELVAQARGE